MTWTKGRGRATRFAIATALLSSAACSSDASGKSVEGVSEQVTWSHDIAPIVSEKCGGCHTAGGIAPFSMDSYASAKPFASAMADAVEQGRMPPFLAQETDDCKPRLPWANDIRLSADQKQLLRTWADAKAPEGKGPAAKLASKLDSSLAREDASMTIPKTMVVEGTTDIHTCVIVDPGLTEDAYVVGRAITPGNAAVLHHVVSYVITPGKNDDGSDRSKDQLEAAVMAEKGVGIGGQYDCFGGPALSTVTTQMLSAWAPGSIPDVAPPNSG
ncbi:MAG TPA: hypothetical protein VGI70_19260, partial [Polyangiales bacterium]